MWLVRKKIMSQSIIATYEIETAHDLEKAAAVMAGEQSAGTFVKTPGETLELLARHGATVERITELDVVDAPSLPCYQTARGTQATGTIRRAEVTIAFPFDNVGASLTALMTTVSGNLYELAQFSGLRLLDVEIPSPFAEVYAGPKFGVAGTRQLSGVADRPLIGTIIKPSVGLSPEATADLVQTLCAAGLDFIKDDELQTNAPYAPFAERVKAVMRVINAHTDATGKKVMYAFNITGDLDVMRRQHDLVVTHGGTCVMVNLVALGLAGVIEICRHAQIPVHGHRAGWGLFARSPAIGMSYIAFQKFFRLAGVDHLHVNGLRNKFCESDDSVARSAQACLRPMLGGYTVMPVFSSGQWAGQAPDTYAALGSVDLIYLAGGGIVAHPGGPAAGVRSIQQGWEAALQGIPLATHARSHPELQQAVDMYGGL
jgi:ribulose-bisphosphate carboxylase large chain